MCQICNHEKQQQIEAALLSGVPLEEIASHFSVSESDLKIHAIMHLGTGDSSSTSIEESIVQKLKLKEAVVLRNTYQEYYSTMKRLGDFISRRVTQAEADDLNLDRLVSKNTVKLYLEAGLQVRETIKTLVDIDEQINGRDTTAASGVLELVSALRGEASTTGPRLLESSGDDD